MSDDLEAQPRDDRARPALVRRSSGRLVAGVCTGIAAHLGVNVVLVRVLFAVFGANGVGLVAYLAVWMLTPDEDDDGSGRSRLGSVREAVRTIWHGHPGDDPSRRRKLILYLLLGLTVGSLIGVTGLGPGSHSTLPLSVAALGAFLIWWRAPEPRRAQWTDNARRYGTRIARRGPLLVAIGGTGLVVAGVASFLAANDALRQARDGAVAIGAILVGVLLVTGPWLLRLGRELGAERRARIREQERAEVAAHLHDSVLQTLALIQAQAADADSVRRLARRQERDLRDWLFTPRAETPDGQPTFAATLRAAAAEVEDAHHISIDVVVVGDAVLDGELTAAVAAAREGMINAAKYSGAQSASVFAEVGDGAVEVFVRDRGGGFDIEQVPADRRGIRDSIVARMARHGGQGSVRTGPTGTEVVLSIPRQASG